MQKFKDTINLMKIYNDTVDGLKNLLVMLKITISAPQNIIKIDDREYDKFLDKLVKF